MVLRKNIYSTLGLLMCASTTLSTTHEILEHQITKLRMLTNSRLQDIHDELEKLHEDDATEQEEKKHALHAEIKIKKWI